MPALPSTPLRWGQLALLGALLVLPVLLIVRVSPNFWLTLSYAVVMSLATYGLYGFDKRRAQVGGWRIPESRLHLFALLGGWPGAYLAQRRFRHKTAKGFFQAIFWITVAAYQIAAVDGLLGWPVFGKMATG